MSFQLKIIFAGTPAFAAVALEALLDAGHQLALVLTQPDRPAGRGLKPRVSAVKQLAEARGLRVMQPASLKDATVVDELAQAGADVMVVVAYGLLLPATVLGLPRLGCLNIHASLLPRWRGAAPVQRAILAGDRETGVTIMQMDRGLDTGPMLLAQPVKIDDSDTTQTLHDKLAAIGAQLIVRALQEPLRPVAQDAALATYAEKISKAEARIDWTRQASEIDRQIRAFNPSPGAYTTAADGHMLKIWRAEVVAAEPALPGTVVHAGADGIVVAAGAGALRLLELQRAGGKRLAAKLFLAGMPLPPGTRFEA
ncbi:MAG: methionyl-tRNA formyltransferase [Burkholderiales bacterium]